MYSLNHSKVEVLATNPNDIRDGLSEFQSDLYTTNGGYVVEPHSIGEPALAYVGSNVAEISPVRSGGHAASIGFVALA